MCVCVCVCVFVRASEGACVRLRTVLAQQNGTYDDNCNICA